MRIFVGLVTEAKPRFLNHEDPRAWSLTDLEELILYGNVVKAQKISLLSSNSSKPLVTPLNIEASYTLSS